MAQDLSSLPNIFPFLCYADAPAAIRWLSSAFGFEEHLVVPGPDGTITHAELRLGRGLIMVGSFKGPARPKRAPALSMNDVEHGVSIYVRDVDAHYARARAAGARIVRELADTDYGSREYVALDPEGYVWSFGTYQPFKG